MMSINSSCFSFIFIFLFFEAVNHFKFVGRWGKQLENGRQQINIVSYAKEIVCELIGIKLELIGMNF